MLFISALISFHLILVGFGVCIVGMRLPRLHFTLRAKPCIGRYNLSLGFSMSIGMHNLFQGDCTSITWCNGPYDPTSSLPISTPFWSSCSQEGREREKKQEVKYSDHKDCYCGRSLHSQTRLQASNAPLCLPVKGQLSICPLNVMSRICLYIISLH